MTLQCRPLKIEASHMNHAYQFEVLGRKQLSIQEPIDLLRQAQVELARWKSSADPWGTVAVLANVTLIPLIFIGNAVELKAADSRYQTVVQRLYGKFGKGGTRIDGQAKNALSLLKEALGVELKLRALTEFVPGFNMLVGLAADSMAAWEAIQLRENGPREMVLRVDALDGKISDAQAQLIGLGIGRADFLSRAQTKSITA